MDLQALKRRRPLHIVDLGALSKDYEGLKVGLRVATMGENIEAATAAQACIRRLAAQHHKETADLFVDESLYADTRAVEVLARVCRNPDNPDEPAFPSAEWMRETFSTDQAAVLLDLYNAHVYRQDPRRREFTDAEVEAFADRLNMYDTLEMGDVVDTVLRAMPPAAVCDLSAHFARKLRAARDEAIAVQWKAQEKAAEETQAKADA